MQPDPCHRNLLVAPCLRFIVIAAFIEGGIFFGAFTYVAADLNARFGLSFSAVGAVVATFGVGCLLYAGSVRGQVRRCGEH